MFPEIIRDEVFRLETHRLWLRWPTMGDAFDGPKPPSSHIVDFPSDGRQAGETRALGTACIAGWRGDNQQGAGLHLIVETKADRMPIGTVHLHGRAKGTVELDYYLLPNRRHHGFMTEAVQAVVHAAFLVRVSAEIAASPAAGDRGGRGVLERCGFTYLGSGMRPGRIGQGLTACDHFRLDRRTWLSLQGWGIPGLGAKLQGDPYGKAEVGASCCP